MAAEAAGHEARMKIVVPPTGREPALQLLVLPRRPGPTWAEYSARADYLPPVHCRLCLDSPVKVSSPNGAALDEVPDAKEDVASSKSVAQME